MNNQDNQENKTYTWNYADQCAYDEKSARRKQRRATRNWTIGMILAFAAVLAMLAGVLIWYEYTGRDALSQEALDAGEVAEIVNPSLVLIYCETAKPNQYTYGTGFFITSDGYIATNYHILENTKSIRVILWTGKEYNPTLVGYDAEQDLAVLKIAGIGHPTVSVGNSDSVRVGDTAYVLGHPSGGSAAWSVTEGIVSFLGRTTKEHPKAHMIQFDAAANPGNSGGVLCNDRAEVVGVVTSRLADTQGIGFAIPVNEAMPVLQKIMDDAKK